MARRTTPDAASEGIGAGVVLAVIACIGPRRGKPLAVIGWILSFIALILGLIMLGQRVVQVSLAAEGFQ